jgi:hypothetical protein
MKTQNLKMLMDLRRAEEFISDELECRRLYDDDEDDEDGYIKSAEAALAAIRRAIDICIILTYE